jgi:hypothetical protein
VQRAAKASGVCATILVLTLSGKAASAQPIPSPYLSPGFSPPVNPQTSAPQPYPVPQLYTHSTSEPLSVTATVESYCTFEGNTGNTITMSCSFNTPMAADFIGGGQVNLLPAGTFAMSAAGILSQQGLNPFCSFNLPAQATPSTAELPPYFSTFEVCF